MSSAEPNLKKPLTIIGLLSVVILGFLFWLIYFQEAPESMQAHRFAFLPALNTCFNALSAVLITTGVVLIRRGYKRAHVICMITATLSSACFLAGYLVYHYTGEHTRYDAEGLLRLIYILLLISHIILAAVILPLILTTLYFAASKRWSLHRKLAKWTFPLWLYVSVTGVIIFAMLRL